MLIHFLKICVDEGFLVFRSTSMVMLCFFFSIITISAYFGQTFTGIGLLVVILLAPSTWNILFCESSTFVFLGFNGRSAGSDIWWPSLHIRTSAAPHPLKLAEPEWLDFLREIFG